jgi:hypothetical protein
MAPAFSKPLPNLRPPGTRKRTISTALSSGDNVDATAVKKRKLAAAAKEAERLAALHREHQPSVEVEDDPQDAISHVGRHASAEVLLEEDNYVTDLTGDDNDEPELVLEEPQKETEEEEISKNLLRRMD